MVTNVLRATNGMFLPIFVVLFIILIGQACKKGDDAVTPTTKPPVKVLTPDEKILKAISKFYADSTIFTTYRLVTKENLANLSDAFVSGFEEGVNTTGKFLPETGQYEGNTITVYTYQKLDLAHFIFGYDSPAKNSITATVLKIEGNTIIRDGRVFLTWKKQ